MGTQLLEKMEDGTCKHDGFAATARSFTELLCQRRFRSPVLFHLMFTQVFVLYALGRKYVRMRQLPLVADRRHNLLV